MESESEKGSEKIFIKKTSPQTNVWVYNRNNNLYCYGVSYTKSAFAKNYLFETSDNIILGR